MTKIIEVNRLTKSFGNVQAVKDISFHVKEGALFSFLGTNGAGKSTTIAIILTLLKQDEGHITVKGYTVGKQDALIRKEIGVVFQNSLLDPLLTVKENLKLRSAFYYKTKQEIEQSIQRVIELASLQTFLHRPYGKLSGGERRRTDIARALLHTPSILILDEPTTGLDAENRKSIWNTVLHLQKETNMTVFLTTHYIEEAAGSDYVVVMNEGEIIAKGTPEQLKNDYSENSLIVTPIDRIHFKEVLRINNIQYKEEKSCLIIPLKDTKSAIPVLQKYDDYIASFEVKKSSLDDVFLNITKKEG